MSDSQGDVITFDQFRLESGVSLFDLTADQCRALEALFESALARYPKDRMCGDWHDKLDKIAVMLGELYPTIRAPGEIFAVCRWAVNEAMGIGATTGQVLQQADVGATTSVGGGGRGR
jgi:hypothetical protein